jgi:Holliday junction DNA helicase RuvA
MYEFIRGKLFSSTNNRAVVDANGVGYSLGISLNSFATLPEIGKDVLLYTHYHVTENSQALYGFVTSQERELFEVLISINKVGPKVGLSALSTLSVEQIVAAVENQDVNAFKSVSGVGPKTAQRILLELKGKLKISISKDSKKGSTKEKSVTQGVREEAYTALIALGYTEQAVRVALTRIDDEFEDDAEVHEWITTALKVI